MSGGTFWIWVAICVAAWFAAVWLIAAWLDHDDDLATYRWPIDDDGDYLCAIHDDDPGPPWPIDEYLIDEDQL